jgi:predicted PurR-regulated permease PerM
VVLLVVENVKEMIANGEEYQQKYYALINLLYTEYNINLKEEGIKLLNQYNLTASLKGLINAFSTSLGNVFLVLIYVLFLVAEESTFTAKIKAISSSREKYVSILRTLKSINSTIGKYIALKTSVSLITGLLTLIVLSILKVDYPLFWAMLVFFFNYIPNIGSIIATIFPSVMALIQFDSLTMFLVVLASISVIQIIIGNFVEPKIMGDSLNISPLVVILALVFWGFLWGITGMIICVPLTVILIIVLSKFPMTRNIAVILSEKGKV